MQRVPIMQWTPWTNRSRIIRIGSCAVNLTRLGGTSSSSCNEGHGTLLLRIALDHVSEGFPGFACALCVIGAFYQGPLDEEVYVEP